MSPPAFVFRITIVPCGTRVTALQTQRRTPRAVRVREILGVELEPQAVLRVLGRQDEAGRRQARVGGVLVDVLGDLERRRGQSRPA